MKLNFVSAIGEETSVSGKPGQSLMSAAVAANVAGIEGECGGMLTCATCHVYVRAPFLSALPPPADDETQMLECTAAPVQENSRLSCQIELRGELDGLTVDVPPRQY